MKLRGIIFVAMLAIAVTQTSCALLGMAGGAMVVRPGLVEEDDIISVRQDVLRTYTEETSVFVTKDASTTASLEYVARIRVKPEQACTTSREVKVTKRHVKVKGGKLLAKGIFLAVATGAVSGWADDIEMESTDPDNDDELEMAENAEIIVFLADLAWLTTAFRAIGQANDAVIFEQPGTPKTSCVPQCRYNLQPAYLRMPLEGADYCFELGRLNSALELRVSYDHVASQARRTLSSSRLRAFLQFEPEDIFSEEVIFPGCQDSRAKNCRFFVAASGGGP